MNKCIIITAIATAVCAIIAGFIFLLLAVRENQLKFVEDKNNIQHLKEGLASVQRRNEETVNALLKMHLEILNSKYDFNDKIDYINYRVIQLQNKVDYEFSYTLRHLVDQKINSLENALKQEFVSVNKTIGKLQSLFNERFPSSCIGKPSGIYDIFIPGMDPFPVPCDSTLAGPGWTVVQRRMDGSIQFNRNWTDYAEGFGNLETEFWIGLEKLHQLTNSQPYELYIYLMDFQNETRYALYNEFQIGSKDEMFNLTIGQYSGDAGDALKYHNTMKFSTFDRDNDNSTNHCAYFFESGWWFNACCNCNLNGPYNTVDTDKEDPGIDWKEWHKKPLKFTQMMIRPKNN